MFKKYIGKKITIKFKKDHAFYEKDEGVDLAGTLISHSSGFIEFSEDESDCNIPIYCFNTNEIQNFSPCEWDDFYEKEALFSIWLGEQRAQDTPIGDLSKDILRDREAVGLRSHGEILSYLTGKGVNEKALRALHDANLKFRRENG